MKQLIIIAACVAATGCSTYRVEIEHISAPNKGPPFNDKPEWTVDQVNACGKRVLGNAFFETCTGHVFKSDDGQPWTVTFRTGVEWGGGGR